MRTTKWSCESSPREEDSEKESSEFEGILDKLTKKSISLVKLIGNNANTTMDIKNKVREVKRLVENLNYRMQYEINQEKKRNQKRKSTNARTRNLKRTDKDNPWHRGYYSSLISIFDNK